jgi:hypothetical protein
LFWDLNELLAAYNSPEATQGHSERVLNDVGGIDVVYRELAFVFAHGECYEFSMLLEPPFEVSALFNAAVVGAGTAVEVQNSFMMKGSFNVERTDAQTPSKGVLCSTA